MKNRFEFRFALELRLEIDPILRRRSSTGVCIFLDMYARARARVRAHTYTRAKTHHSMLLYPLRQQ